MSLIAYRWSWTRACPGPALCPGSAGRGPPAPHPPQAYTDHSRKLTVVFRIRDVLIRIWIRGSVPLYYGSRSF